MPTTVITDINWRDFIRPAVTEDGMPEIIPRDFACGSSEAADIGLAPVEEFPNVMVPEDEWKERINEMNEEQGFPVHHLRRGNAKAKNQNGYGYCWAYGITSCLESVRVKTGQPYVELAPQSLGWMVNWRNRGYYPSHAIQGINEKGVCRNELVGDSTFNPRNFEDGWEEDALNYRAMEWWDTNRRTEKDMVKQCVSILLTGHPLYIAYNWWNHALMMGGLVWDEGERYNLKWLAINSHNDGEIYLTGSRGVPSEAYGVRSVTHP